MKTFNFLGLSAILVSTMITTPIHAVTEIKGTSFSTETGEMLKDNIQPLSFPIIGDRLDDEMSSLAKTLSTARYLSGSITEDEWMRFMSASRENQLPFYTQASVVANLNDDLQILDPEYLVAHKTTFTNDLGTTQTWNTPEYSHTVENSVSTTNTVSTGISTTVDSSFKIPFIGGTDISVTATFDYSNAKTVTNTTTDTWTIPSQDIQIEPGQTVRVEWVVTLGKAAGTANLDVRLEGAVPYSMSSDGTIVGRHMRNSFNDYDRYLNSGVITNYSPFTPAQRNLYTVREGNSVDRVFGKANYEVKQGLEMTMKVYEVRDGNGRASSNDRLIESRTFSADKLRVK